MANDVPTDVTLTVVPETDGGSGVVAPMLHGALDVTALDLPTRSPDRYQVVAEHGRGGLGRVLRVHDRELGRVVAVKELLRRGHQADARFVREATVTARLEHPGIVPVYEAGRWPDGTPYYAMKLVAGRPLSALITAAGSAIDARLALVPHVVAVADAIAYAHARGILHRDLKPANVIVGDFGETVVIDWGLAKDVSDGAPPSDEHLGVPYRSASDDDLTITGTTLGTPAYMAPEQGLGRPCQASDVYSIGAILYHVVAGRPPGQGGIGPLPRGVSRDLAAVIARATAAELTSRYGDARDLADDLRRFLRREPVTARRYRAIDRLALAAARNRRLALLGAASLVAITALSLVGVALIDRQRARAVDAEAVARGAQRTAEHNVGALTLANARMLLATDPSRAVEAIGRYRGDDAVAASLVRAEAIGLGVAAQRLTAHADGVFLLAATPGGELITGGQDGQILATDPASGRSRVLAGDVVPAVTPVYASSIDRLAYVSVSGALIVRDRAGPPRSVALSGTPPQRLSVSPRGDVVAVLRRDGAIDVWRDGAERVVGAGRLPDAVEVVALDDRVVAIADHGVAAFPFTGGAIHRRFDGHVVSVAVDAAGQRLAIGTAAGQVQRWHLPDLVPEPPRAVCKGAVTAVAVDTPRWLAYGCGERLAGAIDTEAAADVLVLLDAPARRVATDADGSLLVVGSAEGVVHVRDLATGVSQELRGHQARIARVRAPSPTLPYVVSSDDKGEVRLWRPPHWPARIVAGAAPTSAAWIADGDRRLVAAGEGSLRNWDLVSGVCTRMPGHSSLVSVLRITPDHRRAISGGYDGTARLWDLSSSAPLGTLARHAAAIADVELLDDETAVVGGNDGLIVAWSPASGRERVLHHDRRAIYLLEPLRAIDAVAATTADGRLLIVPRDGAVRQVPGVVGLALRASSDGALLATGDGHGVVTLVEPRTERATTILRLGEGVRHLAFDVAGRRLAVAGERGALAVVALGAEPVTMLSLAETRARVVTFSTDGRLLAIGGSDGAIRVLVLDEQRWIVPRLHASELKTLQFSSDDRQLVATSVDGRIALVDVAQMRSLPAHHAGTSLVPVPFLPCPEGSP